MSQIANSPFDVTAPVASLAEGGGPVTLVEGRTFAISDPSGDIASDVAQGLFVLDTRVLSRFELRVNGAPLQTLAIESREPYAATFVTLAQAAPGHADSELTVMRRRHVGKGMRDDLVVTNYGLEVVPITVEVHVDVDFADLFAVKEGRVDAHRHRSAHVQNGTIWFEDHGDSTDKRVTIKATGNPTVKAGHLVWEAKLQPGETWQACMGFVVSVDGEEIEPRFRCGGDDGTSVPAERMREWRTTVPTVETDHVGLASAVQRSDSDLGALRVFDPDHPDMPILAAGAPWFMTPFGRDSLLTGWMALIADHTLAEGVLETLARFQGQDANPETEEEPGKILHEMRFQGATSSSLDQATVYYGSVDSSALFVMLLGELLRWDPRNEMGERLVPHADRALEWMENHGDRDGDGYVEYARSTDKGLGNQGWKDSWDSVRHADGELARAPIALCEVQGYTYAAYVARARIAEYVGDEATLQRYREKADELRRRFNEDFWLDDQGTFALALDGDKRQVAAVASNVGHCLWTGIVDPEKARSVADRLVADDMFSGWGVRTLSTSMPAYNPASYHNGSVWPHDNALCAQGLMRYGFVDHAHRVIGAQLDLAARIPGSLPELFAGYARGDVAVPAAYPAACSPQAWAAASPLMWLRTILRLDPIVARGQMHLAPVLPPGVGRLHVEGINIGDRRITIHVEGDDVTVEGAEGIEILVEPRPPLSSLLDHAPS
ncbi:MAG TPA: glycogen debranching N-terminal domain-containing protein [Acidimicrobiales bacterium]|nr:glycogen debranching N-terminal domain-containing protein [Acidimicrobiales bacterium]